MGGDGLEKGEAGILIGIEWDGVSFPKGPENEGIKEMARGRERVAMRKRENGRYESG